MSDRLFGLDPVVSGESRVLIVGSFPSLLSLRHQEYYANPRNDFWRIMERNLGIPAYLPYSERTSLICGQGIALWDVVRSCRRTGSADAAIRDPEPAAIPHLLISHPLITCIFCNGRAAEKGLQTALLTDESGDLFRYPDIRYLPSTSPAHAIPFERKCAAWQEVVLFSRESGS